jgi:cytoskeletal protein CcmA (bactofilin family)
MKPNDTYGNYTCIEQSTELNGNINTKSDIRIDGTMEGNIQTKGKLIIGKEATVKGDVNCLNADIEGHFQGRLTAQEMLSLRSESVVVGEVIIGKLMVASGATFNAKCAMKNSTNNIKALYKESEKTA